MTSAPIRLAANSADTFTFAGANRYPIFAGGPVNPIVAQSRAILGAVAGKENEVGQWRGLSQRAFAANAAPELKEQLAALTPKVEEADAKIRAAAQPQKQHFEINWLP